MFANGDVLLMHGLFPPAGLAGTDIDGSGGSILEA